MHARNIQLVILAGQVWQGCALSEVERLEVASEDAAIEALASFLAWLPRERALEVARAALTSEFPVLAGWASATALVAEPPAAAEPYDRSRYGDPVYVVVHRADPVYDDVPGLVYEPFYVSAYID